MLEAEAWVAVAFVLFLGLLVYLGAHRRLLDGIEVVREGDTLERGDDRGRTDEVTQPEGRQRPRLGERPGDDERGVITDELER